MSVNTAHANSGVLIYSGEVILLYCNDVTMGVGKDLGHDLAGNKKGRVYLTSHRFIFTASDPSDPLKSFAAPFFSLSKVELEQPIFGANYIKGEVKGQPQGGFANKAVDFKLTFKKGGAIEFGQAMLKVASMTNSHYTPAFTTAPPPYAAPPGQWGPAPPPKYTPPTQGYYGWTPPTQAFPDRPMEGSVYQYDAPPPYPGMGGPVGFTVPGAQAMDPKAAEAAASAYQDPSAPAYAYVPPPAYGEQPPAYSAVGKKTN